MPACDASLACLHALPLPPPLQRLINHEADNFTFHVEVENGGWYYLYFANCETQTPVSFNLHLEMYNMLPSGSKDYLSVGQTELDVVYWVSGGAGRGCGMGAPLVRGWVGRRGLD